MKICKYSSLSVAFMAILMSFVVTATAQTISPEMLQQAAAMGYSESDIRAQLKAQQSGNSTNATTTATNLQTNTSGQVQRVDPMGDSSSPYINRVVAPDTLLLMANSTNRFATFGQDFFRNDRVSFEPNINIPTPKSYLLTSGDEVVITIWGDSELLYKEAISPDGVINVPNYGPINISGMRVDEAQRHLEQRLSSVYNSLGSSSQLMLSVGQIGSIRVNVSGEVLNPGTYTVPAIANMFHLLHLSGGTTNIGDMRKIELYRDSKLVTTLDLYNYIIKGDAAGNTLLKDGDVIVVNPYKVRVAATGEIKRPMYYQLSEDDTVENLIEYVGGFNDAAYKNELKIFRNNGKDREIMMVGSNDFAAVKLTDGDSVLISRANNEYKNIISINGAVWRGGDFQYDDQTSTLKDLIERAGGLRGDAFANRGIITRRNPDYTTTIINFVTADIASGAVNVDLQNYDKVYIPMIESLREDYTVTISGEVNTPQTFKFHENMRVEDAIIMAGGLKESASLATLDVTRRVNNNQSLEYSETIAETYNFQINEDLSLNQSTSDFVLEPFDLIVIRRSPQYQEQKKIYIMGEVLFPGIYTLVNDRTFLSDVVAMAKGITPNAYVAGTSLSRQTKAANSNANDVNNDNFFTPSNITDMALDNIKEATGGRDTLNVNRADVRIYSVGVDMERAMADPHGEGDVLLQDRDIVLIPHNTNIVNIVGSVFYPNATSYSTTKLKHYISEGGGYNKAAVKKPFVIYSNGKVATTKNYVFFKKKPRVEPGSMVVVPSKANREKASLTEIITAASSMASVAASISTLGVAIGK